ncbi:RNA-binding motif protein, X chromosome-like isoform X2 [Anneissia japonica]|uniref:RNA-binding motif protein, X chromosome-like isoform X2 n=1 Tax=Anneissia japonica TaxID=1529436 RepID=UPI001425A02B|nr:RNA-binding motif protein, X chromosome-like isoform X2 [Anneissia japonica]
MPPAEKDRPGKVFVGGLAIETTEGAIKAKFSKFGKISEVLLVKNRETEVSRGFGFVTFENPAAADAAVKEMNGFVLDGKPLKVDNALKALHTHDAGSRGRGGRGGSMGRGGPPRGGFSGRGHPPPLMRRGLSGPPRGGPPRGGPPRGGSSRGAPRGRGGLLGDGRSMMMRGRGGAGSPRSNGPRPMGPRSEPRPFPGGPNGRPLPPSLLDHDAEMRPGRSRGGYEDNYGPPAQRPGGDRALLSTPRRYVDDEYGPPMKRSRPEPSYPDQAVEEYPPARGGYAQEENGYGNHRAPDYIPERPSKHSLYGRSPAREYGDSRAELPPRDPVHARDPGQPRDSVLGRAPSRYEYGDARPELGPSRDRLAREPAVARGYPAAREAPRDYPPRERDPYASRGSYAEPAAERDPYPAARREPATASRGYAAGGYEEREYPPRADAYERSAQQPSYSREYPGETRPVRPARPAYADPYVDPAAAKDYDHG